MSDRIETLKLTDEQMLAAAQRIDSRIPTLRGVANAQLERVLDATVTCPKCEGAKTLPPASGERWVNCYYCDGTGTVTVRQILERDGGEK